MDFDFSDDQEQLRDAVRKWVDKGYTFERRRAAVAAQPLLHVAQQAGNEVSGRGGQRRLCLGWEAQVGAPVDNLAAGGHGVVWGRARG